MTDPGPTAPPLDVPPSRILPGSVRTLVTAVTAVTAVVFGSLVLGGIGLAACGGSAEPIVADAAVTEADATEAGTGTEAGARPAISATLHRDCADGGACSASEQCETRSHSEGATVTCEIRCASDADCPQGHRCHTAPCVPGDVMCLLCATE